MQRKLYVYINTFFIFLLFYTGIATSIINIILSIGINHVFLYLLLINTAKTGKNSSKILPITYNIKDKTTADDTDTYSTSYNLLPTTEKIKTELSSFQISINNHARSMQSKVQYYDTLHLWGLERNGHFKLITHKFNLCNINTWFYCMSQPIQVKNLYKDEFYKLIELQNLELKLFKTKLSDKSNDIF
jgi:hypothetical protein